MGWTVQDAMYFGGENFQRQNGVDAARRVPPVEYGEAYRRTSRRGDGCASSRFLQSVHRAAMVSRRQDRRRRGDSRTGRDPSREDALRFYTLGSAWFSLDEDKRGSLEPGKFADLAVLTKDYMTVPVEQIGSLESVLTMVAGRVVYAVAPYK